MHLGIYNLNVQVEQPGSSLLQKFPSMIHIMALGGLGRACTQRLCCAQFRRSVLILASLEYLASAVGPHDLDN